MIKIKPPRCPNCGVTKLERHPQRPDVLRCVNCKEHLLRHDCDCDDSFPDPCYRD